MKTKKTPPTRFEWRRRKAGLTVPCHSVRFSAQWLNGNDPDFVPSYPKQQSPRLFAATERIVGENLTEMSKIDEKVALKIDDMFSKLFSGLRDSFANGTFWWNDYHNSQVVYGTAKEDDNPDLYIVDVDPYVKDWSEVLIEDREYEFSYEVYYTLERMEELRDKEGGENLKFEKTIEIVKEIVAGFQKTEQKDVNSTIEYVNSILRRLS